MFYKFETLDKNILEIIKKEKNFGITCDTGNLWLNDKSFYKKISAFHNKITHVHLKDRDINGKNVRIGEGKVNFKLFFKQLKKINYVNTFTFETHRGSDSFITAKSNLNFIKNLLDASH